MTFAWLSAILEIDTNPGKEIVMAEGEKLTLQIFKDIAESYGGKCLSKEYHRIEEPLNFRCKNGHEFAIVANRVKNKGTFCIQCNKIARRETVCRDSSYYKKLIEDRGGNIITKMPAKMHPKDKLVIQCAKGHIFKKRCGVLNSDPKSYCQICFFESRMEGIERLQEKAIARGGEMLSTEYHGLRAKYKFRCKHGCEFELTGHDLLYQNMFCKIHYGLKRPRDL